MEMHSLSARQPASEHGSSTLSRVIDVLLDSGSDLMRHQALLTAIDWRQVGRSHIDRLLASVAQFGKPLPSSLVRHLTLAGHAFSEEQVLHIAAEVGTLSQLNGCVRGHPLPPALRRAAVDVALKPALEAGVAAALAKRLADLGEPSLACTVALGQWRQAPEVLRAVRRPLAEAIAAMPTLRVRLFGFSTTHSLAEALVTAFAVGGCNAAVSEADFGSAVAELHTAVEDSDAAILLLDPESYFSPDWRDDVTRQGERLGQKLDALARAITAFTARSATPLFINTLPAASTPSLGHVDRSNAAGAAFLADRVNRRLAEIAAGSASVSLVDTDVALTEVAPTARCDAKFWYYGRIAYSNAATRHLAHAFAQAWQSRARGPAKVVALDFDNTLWGGVYGDDGLDRLACGDDFPGNAFKAFQRECLRLKSQGMLLVGLSKNNADAIEVFDRHPGVVLRRDDFAAIAIDWKPKPQNVRRLARELNLGLDTFVFLDDSPHEREAMRLMCPEVTVPEMPVDAAERPAWLRMLACTWPVRITAEDAQRAGMYAAERKARELRETAASYEDYLAELEQHLVVESLSRETLARVAQLHQRTNQFNLTTRRFGEADLEAFMAGPDSTRVLLGRASDRFGDHGIVVAGVVTLGGRTACIESLLMSCRVIGRRIETAFLNALMSDLVGRGVERIEAAFLPTAKNGMVSDLYPAHGFIAIEGQGEGRHYAWCKGESALPDSPFVTIQWRTA
jgi:FkbH-like protein